MGSCARCTDLDRPNRRAVIRRKGGAVDEIIWQTRTARLLARYLAKRTRGPVFLTDRAARVQLAATDLHLASVGVAEQSDDP